MLGRGHFVVFRLGEHPEGPQALVQIPHERRHPGTDRAVIVVVQLLSPGGLRAEEGPARHAQVLPPLIEGLVDQEILLFRAHLRDHAAGRRVPEEPQDPYRRPGDGVQLRHRVFQERRHYSGFSAACQAFFRRKASKRPTDFLKRMIERLFQNCLSTSYAPQ